MNRDEAKRLLEFVPDHQRTSCSDDKIANGYTTPGRRGHPRCNRCALLKAAQSDEYAAGLRLDEIIVRLPEVES